MNTADAFVGKARKKDGRNPTITNDSIHKRVVFAHLHVTTYLDKSHANHHFDKCIVPRTMAKGIFWDVHQAVSYIGS